MSEDEGSVSVDIDTSTKPKVRSQPFTALETRVLLDLVAANKKIVESKTTDFGTNNAKKDAWEKMQQEYNLMPEVRNRTADQLKKKWENVKATAKKEVAKNKRETKKTGGGAPVSCLSNDTEKVCAIVPEQMSSLENEFDCDGPTTSTLAKADTEESLDLKSNVPQDNAVLETPKPTKKSGKEALRDPRSRLVDWEYEEHKLRLKTLRVTLEVEEVRLQQAKEQLESQREEQRLRTRIQEIQLHNLTQHEYVGEPLVVIPE